MWSRRSVPRRLTLVLAVFGLLALLPRDARAQVYRWVDNKGVVHYTQSVDNVPERYRDPRLSPSERTETLEAVKALKDLEAMVTPEMKSFEYQWRLRKLEEVVTKSLRAMKRGRVATALSGALGHYRLAGQLIERGVAASRARRAGCGGLAHAAKAGEPALAGDERAAALQAVWRCAAERTEAVEALLNPGPGPWAKRVQPAPKPKP